MKMKTTMTLSNWYGISATAGDVIEIPKHLQAKAKNMPFLKPVRKKADDKDKG